MSHSPQTAMLFGALVAEAASQGLHWLYDTDRIAEIARARGGHTAFTPVDASSYEGVKGYFVHPHLKVGMPTQYGEVLRLALRSILDEGGFDAAAYAQAFAAHFGPGGTYRGYIDRPTRGALTAIAEGRVPSGIDDDQLPATATLPALVAAYHGSNELPEKARAAMQITNVNAVADTYREVFTGLLSRLLEGAALPDALQATAAAADARIRPALTDALASPEPCSVAYGEVTGRTCHLPMAAPLIFHILSRSDSFEEAVERNIKAGGDNAGRAILVGAAMGAAHGITTETGIPLRWALKLVDADRIWADCTDLGG